MAENPLQEFQVLNLAVNIPGPAAAARLQQFGARVIKVEPLHGDMFASFCPAWYAALVAGQQVLRLDLKQPTAHRELDDLLASSDLLITSTRPSSLQRQGLAWDDLHARFPDLCQVAILGYPSPRQELPGHDLTYQAGAGLARPPALPNTLLADLGGAEQAVSAALALLLGRSCGQGGGYSEVTLEEAAETFAAPLRFGLTTPGGLLGGGLPVYNLYPTRQGWLAVAALEPQFWQKLAEGLGLESVQAPYAEFARALLERTALEWQTWAAERDLPLAAVSED
jgi:alpha-methylacyl-CoA racemase